MTRIVEISNSSVERMIAEYRLAILKKSIQIDLSRAVEMAQDVKNLKTIRESIDGRGENVDIII